ncbi:uncharacterized protein LOC110011443 [Sesamum indicum]|uniref:Uncharacterized protein LOC110011443 n=1 Tax=Sesamum indicum TaxID=4182 RepID=A0A8M8UTN4_SESIN|nr:uncharacterized protein LOC110011443 [Sesamum indicum]
MEAKATGEPQTLRPVEDPPVESKEEEINSSVPSPITVDKTTSMEEPPAKTISELEVEVWGKSVKVNLSYLHPLPTERDEEALRALVMKMLTTEEEARVPPSFNRNEGSSTSSLVELKDEKLVIVRVKTTAPNNADGLAGLKDEKIPKEEAVCRFCFHKFEDDNVLKTKCRCKFTLIHEHCAVEWSREKGNNIKCDVCDQDIQNIPVTLSLSDQDKLEKPSRFRNWMGRFKGRA